MEPQTASEYEQAKQRYEAALDHLRAISQDFSEAGQQAFLKALQDSRSAYADLYWSSLKANDPR